MFGNNPYSISGGSYLTEPKKNNPFSIAPNAAPLPENDPYRKVTNITSAMNEVGLQVPERKPQGLSNVLNTVLGYGSKVLDIIDRPRNAVVTAIDDLTDGQDDGGPLGVVKNSLWDALITGKRHTSTSQVMTNWGWDDELNPDGTKKKWYKSLNNSAKGLVGFAGDVLLDPTTYLTAGAVPVGKIAGKEALEAVTKAGLKETLEATLKETGEELTESTVKQALAKAIGKETLDGVNAATVKNLIETSGKASTEAAKKLEAIVGDRAGLFKKSNNAYTPGGRQLQNFLTGLDSTTQGKMYDNLFEELAKAPSRMSPKNKLSLMNDIISRTDISTEDVYKVIDATKKMTGRQLLTTKAIADAVGSKVTAIEVLGYGKKLGDTAFKDKLTTLLTNGGEELLAKSASEAASLEVKFANGLSHVYDQLTGDVYMKFRGKAIMNITAGAGDKVAQTVNKIANFNPVAKVADRVSDLLGSTFKTGYVSKAVERANPERAAQIRQFFETTKSMIQKETGIPKHALDAVMSAYDDDILGNQKVRKALTYFIERGISDEGYAAKKWEDIAKALTPDELKLVEKGYTQHVMLMSAVREFDKGFSSYAKEAAEDASDDYVRHFYKQPPSVVEDIASAMTREQKVGAKTRVQGGFDTDRRFKTLAQAAAKTEGKLTPVDDILTVDSLRYMESWRVALNQQLAGVMENLANVTDDVGRIVSMEKRDGFVKLTSFGDKYYVHTDVARELKRFTDIFVDDQAMNKWVEYLDAATNFIKGWQTSKNPGFLLKNIFGETFMNWMAHVSIGAHGLAQDILSNAGQHKITRVGNRVLYNDGSELKVLADLATKEWTNDAGVKSTQYYAKNLAGELVDLAGEKGVPLINERYEDFVTQQLKQLGVKTYNIGGRELTADQILRNFYDLGLGWSGITKGNLVDNMQSTLKKQMGTTSALQRLNPFSTYDRVTSQIGDWTETWTRLAHMLDRIEKGYSFQEAAMDVRKYHVDYRDLTPIERNVFRRLAPYYTYMRKNVPIQLRTMLTEPGKFSVIGKLVNMSYGGLSDVGNMPDYAREDLAIPLFEDDKGNVTYINWGLPISDLARLKYDLGDLWQTNVLDMLHPGIKSQFEITTNSNIGLGGMPIEKFEGEKTQIIPGVGPEVIPKKLDYGIQQLGMVQNIRKTLGELFTQGDPMKPESPIPFLGSVIKTVNPTQVRTSNEYQYADQLQSYKKQLEQQGIYVPDTAVYEMIRKLRIQEYGNNPYSIKRG